MEIIKKEQVEKKKNSLNCKVSEYYFKNEKLDLGVASIKGRYPNEGFCLNLVSDELIYILEGSIKIIFENKEVELEKEDAIIINAGEKYYWNSNNECKAVMVCNPPFRVEQYKNIK